MEIKNLNYYFLAFARLMGLRILRKRCNGKWYVEDCVNILSKKAVTTETGSNISETYFSRSLMLPFVCNLLQEFPIGSYINVIHSV